MEATLRRDRLTLTGLMRRAGRAVGDEGSIPSVRNDRSRVSELKVEQRKRRMELVEARRGVSSLVEAVKRPAFDWVDPVLKRVVARGDTWRDAIAEHGNLLRRATGANRRNGDEGKALVRWMEGQTALLYDLLDRGTLSDVSDGRIQLITSGASAVSCTPVENEVDSVARRAACCSS